MMAKHLPEPDDQCENTSPYLYAEEELDWETYAESVFDSYVESEIDAYLEGAAVSNAPDHDEGEMLAPPSNGQRRRRGRGV
ncbi:hypothetical protein [Ruegeria sp. HKCCE3926]|uniref:hypothetical protein n=1 Tax=Ruegeria sp. HKCCE3926 TaxID=2794831 RepID=UPI001AE65557|nr:hypothetical protein [Ruegeria sp. HKCCE3926]